MKKHIHIQVAGKAGCGKSTIAEIIHKALWRHGIHVDKVIDEDASTRADEFIEKIIKDSHADYEVVIETKQVRHENQNRLCQQFK